MKNAKKLLALLLAMTMLFALCACGGDDSTNKKDDDDKKTETSQSVNADPSVAPSTAPSQNNTQPTTNNNSDTANKAPIGTWLLEEEGVIFTLNHDGTGELNGEAINWELLSNNSLRLFADDGKEQFLTFTLNTNSVSFFTEDGEESVWVKYTGSTETPDIDVEEPDVDVEITYDDTLIGTWYMDDATMVLAANGAGEVYAGDSEGVELEWGTVDGVLVIAFGGDEYYALYEISGNTLTLTYEDGETETWTK